MDPEKQWRKLKATLPRPWTESQVRTVLDIFGNVHWAEDQVFEVHSATVLKAKIELLDPVDWQLHAHLIRAYVDCAAQLIKAREGEVISFDGYHFTALFSHKLNSAVESALLMSRALEDLIAPAFMTTQPNLKLKFRHAIGVARGSVRIVTASSNFRTMYSILGQPIASSEALVHLSEPGVWITAEVFENLSPNTKISEQGYMWKRERFKGPGSPDIYKSTWRTFPW